MKKGAAVVLSLIAGAVLLIACAGLLASCRARPPEQVTLSAAVDEKARAALDAALTEYNSQARKYTARLLPAGSGEADLLLGPSRDGGTVWRSLGWRLWAKLERLAGFEGDLARPLILPLREGRVDAEAFQSLLEDLRLRGVVPLVVPRSPVVYSWALEQYLGRLGGEGAVHRDDWIRKGWLVLSADLRYAIDAVDRNRAVFLLGSDMMGGFLGRTAESHPEGFPLPGSQSPGAAWVLGRGEIFVVPELTRHRAGAVDLLVYLTSKGLARRFSEELPGNFYFWTDAPPAGKLPDVHGPTVFLDPEPR